MLHCATILFLQTLKSWNFFSRQAYLFITLIINYVRFKINQCINEHVVRKQTCGTPCIKPPTLLTDLMTKSQEPQNRLCNENRHATLKRRSLRTDSENFSQVHDPDPLKPFLFIYFCSILIRTAMLQVTLMVTISSYQYGTFSTTMFQVRPR